jgi:sterol desaturase/sphingolipid hydroxylase (fatty acid hydroxylase superfamily)
MQQYLASLVLDVFRLSIWLVLLGIIFIPLEKLCAQRRQPIWRRELLIDLGYYFLNSLLPQLLMILPMSIVAWCVHHFMPGMLSFGAMLPLRTRFVLAIVVGEFSTYWGHRWSHEIPWMWRFHAIHHSSQEMDWLVNTRAHPLDMFFGRFSGLLPIYMLGLAQPTGDTADLVPVLYSLIGTVWSFFVHANIGWRFGWLEQVLATPAFHHWHHTNDGAKFINKNYATILPIMDTLFGTLYLPKQRWPEQYGIEAPIANSFVGQLLQPLLGTRSIVATGNDKQHSKEIH